MDLLYFKLFLGVILSAACAALVPSDDVIWFPVEDQEGVFVSNYGERYKTNWNSRRARFSGNFDTRRSSFPLRKSDEVLSVSESKYQSPEPYKTRRSARLDATLESIAKWHRLFGEKHAGRKWQFTERPDRFGRQQSLTDLFDIHNRPVEVTTSTTTRNWGGSFWAQGSDSTTSADRLVFPEDPNDGLNIPTTQPTAQVRPETTTTSECERTCQVTPEFNPVCGTDAVTYTNMGRLKCAKQCGKVVDFGHFGRCGTGREARTPPRANSLLAWT